VDGFGGHFCQLHVFQVCIPQHVYQLHKNIHLEKCGPDTSVKGHVDENTDGVENEISQRVVKHDDQSLAELFVLGELLVAKLAVSRQVGHHSHCLNLNLFVLGC